MQLPLSAGIVIKETILTIFSGIDPIASANVQRWAAAAAVGRIDAEQRVRFHRQHPTDNDHNV